MSECTNCQGAGIIETFTGYRITGSGYGDAEEIEEERICDECNGTGEEE